MKFEKTPEISSITYMKKVKPSAVSLRSLSFDRKNQEMLYFYKN